MHKILSSSVYRFPNSSCCKTETLLMCQLGFILIRDGSTMLDIYSCICGGFVAVIVGVGGWDYIVPLRIKKNLLRSFSQNSIEFSILVRFGLGFK